MLLLNYACDILLSNILLCDRILIGHLMDTNFYIYIFFCRINMNKKLHGRLLFHMFEPIRFNLTYFILPTKCVFLHRRASLNTE